MAVLDSVMANLQSIGFFRLALPFLLTFAMVYGVLEKIDLFGDENRISAIIAVAAGLFVSRFIVGAGIDLPVLVSNYLGAMAVVFMFIMAALLVSGMTGMGGEGYRRFFMYIGAAAGILLFLAWGGLSVMLPTTPSVGGLFIDSMTFVTLLVVLAALALIAWVGGFFPSGDSDEGEATEGEGPG